MQKEIDKKEAVAGILTLNVQTVSATCGSWNAVLYIKLGLS